MPVVNTSNFNTKGNVKCARGLNKELQRLRGWSNNFLGGAKQSKAFVDGFMKVAL